MHKVFISGSMRINHLDKNVLDRIDNIVASEYQVIIGDADGIDSSVQKYLNSKNSSLVIAYCSGKQPRNNAGNWVLKRVHTSATPGTRSFFTAKDKEMADDCDYGLMVWGTESSGTLSNAIELFKKKKISLVYVNKNKAFINVKDIYDIENLTGFMSETSFIKADKKLSLQNTIESFINEQNSSF